MISRTVAAVLLLLLAGCSAGDTLNPVTPQSVGEVQAGSPPVEVPAPPAEEVLPPGAVEHPLAEGLKLRVLAPVGAMPSVRRTVQLLRRRGSEWLQAGEVNLPYLPGGAVSFDTAELPGQGGAIVLEARRNSGVRHGAVAVVGGQLKPLDYHRLVAPEPEITEGVFLYLNKYMNQLWVFRDGSLVATFPTANGRDPWGPQPTWKDFKTNYKTPEGLFPIKQKIVNPPYNSLGGNHPPVAGGAPNNPLGTRWIGLEVFSGDGGGIWGFHGTYAPEQIGTWASEGCIRLNTADAERLYDLAPIGALVRIVGGR